MEVVIFLVWLFSKNLTVQSGQNIGEQHWWPLAGNTPQVLWHMIHYKVSVAITVWKTVTKTQDIFYPTAGAINMLIIVLRKCAHFATGIWECAMCYVIYLIAFQKTRLVYTVHWAISLFVKVLGLAYKLGIKIFIGFGISLVWVWGRD